MKQFCFILFAYLFIASCNIQGSFGGLIGYQKKLMKDDPSIVIESQKNICSENYKPSKVFCVNGKELFHCLSNNNKSLIHIWKPNCSSDLCLPLKSIEEIADSLNAKLYIVAEYYDLSRMKINYKLTTPILGIDCKYYKSSFTKKYLNAFVQDLTEKNDACCYDFYFFEKDKLTMTTNHYKELFIL